MKGNSVLNDTLQQLQTEVTSTASIVDDVMRPIEQKPTPVRYRGWSRTKVLAACRAVAACLVVLLCARIGHCGQDPMSMWVARSSAIVYCKIVEAPEEGEEGWGICEVERVIYGRVPEKQVRLYLSSTHRQFAPRVGAIWRFLLGRRWEADGNIRYGAHMSGPTGVAGFDDDERLQEIVEIIQRGTHLTPPDSAYFLSQYIRASTRIVRAKLTKVGTSAAEWRVLDELEFQPFSEADANAKGMQGVHLKVVDATADQGSQDEKPADLGAEPRPPEPGIVRVGLGTCRLRAETVAGFHAYRDAKRACTEEEIQKQLDRLVTAELKAGTEAILMLRAPKGADTYNLVGNFLPDPKDPGRVEKAWTALTKTIESGKYKDLSIHY